MIIQSRAPSRISLLGGGCDMESYYKDNKAHVINFAVNIYHTVTLYTEQDIFKLPKDEFTTQDDPEFIYKTIKYFKNTSGHFIKIKHEYDGIAKSGLGSSGALMVALAAAFYRRDGRMLLSKSLAECAYKMESEFGGHRTGYQDHYASAYGGMHNFHFTPFTILENEIDLSPIMPFFLLFHTRFYRNKHTLQKSTSTDLDKIAYLSSIFEARKHDPIAVAQLIHETWKLKRKSVSNPTVDFIYDKAMEYGAMAGKLLGSGGGGYMLFMVEPNKQKEFIKKMEDQGPEWWDFSVAKEGATTRILP